MGSELTENRYLFVKLEATLFGSLGFNKGDGEVKGGHIQHEEPNFKFPHAVMTGVTETKSLSSDMCLFTYC